MPVTIIDRGRGPEIEGTRITVYRIMDYVGEQTNREEIAKELFLTREQVDAAIAYIDVNRDELTAAYEQILNRPRENPAWVEAGRAKSTEELKQRLLVRQKHDAAHVDRG